MAWSTPFTATTNGDLLASDWNTSYRDNMLETAVAKATANPEVASDPDSGTEIIPGTWFTSTGANAIAERRITEGNASKDVIESTSSTSYTDLDTYGPAITVVTGTTAIVMICCEIGNSDSNSLSSASFAVSGATTIAAAEAHSLIADGYTAISGGDINMQRRAAYHRLTTLNAGTNTFTMKYMCGSNTGKFRMRQIVVWPI